MGSERSSLLKLTNNKSILTIDLFGGAITDFRCKHIDINPLNFAFTKDQMPANNKEGAPYQGHFLCVGRWGEPSQGEINAGLPNHGQFANGLWKKDNQSENILTMQATAFLEGLSLKRKIILDKEDSVYAVKEMVENINPLGRLYNMVQHPTLAAPFLGKSTIIDCNASLGFDQALYKAIPGNTLHWPHAKDDRQNKIDLRTCTIPYNAVFSFIVKEDSDYGWVTAFSPAHNIVFGYVWKRSEYPWIHLWQHYTHSTIQYRGIEFGTAGIHQPFSEILNTSTILFGEKTYAFIDAGEAVSKNYFSFIQQTPPDFDGVGDIMVTNKQIQIKGKNGAEINLTLSVNLINELSK